MRSYKEFIDFLEALHPELDDIVKGPTSKDETKQKKISDKIQDLYSRGESTGIDGGTPKGSSRMYMKMDKPHKIIVDGKPQHIATGIKTAIKSDLDDHLPKEYKHYKSLGHMQNEAENDNSFTNNEYRILSKKEGGKPNEYEHNPTGIFPPLIEHDKENHEWSHVGHSDDITPEKFRELTKNKDFPEGLSHYEFAHVLNRDWDKRMLNLHHKTPFDEDYDRAEGHPLVKNFLDHQRKYNTPPHDWLHIQNMGIFKHGNKEHIVGRDHGFSEKVMDAYEKSRNKAINPQRS